LIDIVDGEKLVRNVKCTISSV